MLVILLLVELIACIFKCEKQSVISYFYLFNPVHNHLDAELGIAIEVCPRGTGMQNAHFSMVF